MANPVHSKSAKSDNFSGTFYKRWANQMKYWLTTLAFISTIDDSIHVQSSKPSPVESSLAQPETPSQSTSSTQTCLKPEEIDYHCLYKILSVLADNLYDTYYEYKNDKELWEALENEDGLSDDGIERFTSFNKFMMVPIFKQLHEFQDYI